MATADLVCVTGASGFIASHIVRELLAGGYRVRGTVRSLARRDGYAHLLDLPGAESGLELVEADLLVPGAFDGAVRGADTVIHTASPYLLSVGDPQRDLVDPAVLGTVSLLGSCAGAASVRRVVLTSSFAAVSDEPDGARILTEADWNVRSSLTRNPYYFSKAEAERAAWAFMADVPRTFDLVAINPYMVIGPALGPGINTSNQILVDLCAGTYPVILSIAWGIVDVRDVATAHVRALETPAAAGRYLCSGDVMSMREVVAVLREAALPGARLPSLPLDNAVGNVLASLMSHFQPRGVGDFVRTNVGRIPRLDTSKIQGDLSLQFRPSGQVVRDAAADLAQSGYLSTASDPA